MLSVIVKGVKVSVIGLWAMVFLSLLSMLSISIVEYRSYIFLILGLVLLVHFAEYRLMKEKFMAKTKTKLSFMQTMLWGFGYWLPLYVSR